MAFNADFMNIVYQCRESATFRLQDYAIAKLVYETMMVDGNGINQAIKAVQENFPDYKDAPEMVSRFISSAPQGVGGRYDFKRALNETEAARPAMEGNILATQALMVDHAARTLGNDLQKTTKTFAEMGIVLTDDLIREASTTVKEFFASPDGRNANYSHSSMLMIKNTDTITKLVTSIGRTLTAQRKEVKPEVDGPFSAFHGMEDGRDAC